MYLYTSNQIRVLKYSRDVCWLTQRNWEIEGEGESSLPTQFVSNVKACPECSESGILY